MKKNVLLILFVLSSIMVTAQVKILKGVVTDETGMPVPNVNINLKGLKESTVTSINGEYSLKIPLNAKTILFSFIGYETKEVKYAGEASLNVRLVPSSLGLKEVVVVGYGVQKKATMTGAVVSVSSKEILKSPVANMANALTGRVPGLTTYQKSGQPGADGVTIRIRGIESTNGSSPLILVDGVERDFTQLDPNEVESFSVLKDAASTAVFGVRGANGVIIVTSKKGKEGPAKVSATSNYSIQAPTRIPKMIDAGTFAKMVNEARLNDDPTIAPRYIQSEIDIFTNNSNPLEFPNIDWYSSMLKPSSLQQQHNVNISGGTKKTRYYTSVGYLNQNGLMQDFSSKLNRSLDNNYKYDRFNLRSNIDVEVTPTTNIGVMINGIISKTNDPQFGWSALVSSTPMSYPFLYGDKIIQSTSGFYAGSPLMSAVGGSLSEKNANTIALTLNVNQKLDFITKGLLFRNMGSYDSFYSSSVSRSQSFMKYRVVYLPDETGTIVRQLQPYDENGLVTNPSQSWGRNRKIHAESGLEYRRTFGSHSFYGLVLASLDKKWYSASDYSYVPITYNGIVSRFTYDYKSKYMLELNMGYNGSESFPANNRFALFPAVSAAWNLTEEQFVKNIISEDIVDKLKFRVSHGIVGNDGTGSRFLYLNSAYASGGGTMFGDPTPTTKTGYVEGKLGNSNIKWETSSKQNVGIEISMFKKKLSLNADVFQSDRKDILMQANSVPGHVVIYSTQDYFNIGRIKNHGFEIEAKWRQDIGDFSYYFGGNYSFARNKILEMDEVKDLNNPNLWKTGNRIGENYGLIADGFYNNADELARGPIIGNPGLGNARYVDVNGDGKVDQLDYVRIGNPEFPEINYGINLGASYKGFEISALLQGAANTTKILGGKFQKPFDQLGGMMDFAVAERWAPDNIANAIRPRLTMNYNNPNDYLSSSMWARDGSYLKLRNVEFSYTFDRSFIKKLLGVTSTRIYMNGQNLYTWDKLKVIDPEGNTNDSWNYPQLKIYNIGVQIDF